jgi:hypothetical protein
MQLPAHGSVISDSSVILTLCVMRAETYVLHA